MSCGCESYNCITALVNPCSEGTKLSLLAPFSGNATFHIYFNGTVKIIVVEINIGQPVFLPTEFLNENYTHELRLFDGDDLIACYHLKTILSSNSEEYDAPSVNTGGFGGKGYEGNGENEQDFPELLTKTLLTVELNGQSYTQDYWVQTGANVAWKDSDQTFTGYVVLNWTN